MAPSWFPDLHDDVERAGDGQVGRVVAINPAVRDEVRVAWAIGEPSWELVGFLRPRDPDPAV